MPQRSTCLFSKVGKKVEVRGIPHLAKNERDMGHPTLCGRVKDRMAILGYFQTSLRDSISASSNSHAYLYNLSEM